MLPLLEIISVLKKISLFSETPENSIAEIAQSLKQEFFGQGRTVLQIGDPGTCMYIIYSGSVSVHKEGQKFAEVGPMQTLGEFSLLNSEPRNATVIAKEDCILLRLDAADFYRIMGSSTEILKGIIKILINRLNIQNSELIDTLKRREAELTRLVDERTKDLQNAMHEISAKNEALEKSFNEISVQKSIIEEKNRNITESIEYAKTIQKSILPLSEQVKSVLPDSFILYRPKDVISGDFYFFHSQKYQTGDEKDNIAVIAAIDCTGHGVPGAMMSMIGSAILNETVGEKRILIPSEILSELHKAIRYALNQENTKSRDGMDLSLCMIDLRRKILNFSGARNSLYYVENDTVVRIRGTKKSIGGVQKEEERIFESHTLPIENPLCFYITTDGYLDQFGGENREKFSQERFKNLILEIHALPMNEQKKIFEERISQWMGDHEQIDDMLLIGVKV